MRVDRFLALRACRRATLGDLVREDKLLQFEGALYRCGIRIHEWWMPSEKIAESALITGMSVSP